LQPRRLLTAARLALRAFARGDDFARYLLAERITALVYPKFRFSEFGRRMLNDEAFIRQYERLQGTDNYHSLDRKFTLDQLLKLVLHLPGDTAECGVYQGASSWFICRGSAGTGKTHHLFDSFEGLSAPGAADGSYWSAGALASSEEEARRTLSEFDHLRYHRGWIPARFEDVRDTAFCFVHVDVDLYEPTLQSVAFFYDRLVPGGMLLCDDYGFDTCPGAFRAMNEFFADKPEAIAMLSTGQGLVIKR
jgi:O-methyltransferase